MGGSLSGRDDGSSKQRDAEREAAKRKEANRKKRDRAKAKKAAEANEALQERAEASEARVAELEGEREAREADAAATAEEGDLAPKPCVAPEACLPLLRTVDNVMMMPWPVSVLSATPRTTCKDHPTWPTHRELPGLCATPASRSA